MKTIMMPLCLTLGTFSLLAAGCASGPPKTSVTVFGPEVAQISGPDCLDTTELYHQIGDNSFSATNSDWSIPNEEKHPARAVTRSIVQTHDKDGRLIQLEFIEVTGSPTLMFAQYDGPGGPAKVMSAALNQMQKNGAIINDTRK